MKLKGQTLLEAILALAVISIILGIISVIVVSSLSNANAGKNQGIATQYAQEGLEIVRKIRNADYVGFKNYSGNYCLAKGSTTLQSSGTCSSPNADNFIRSVTIEQSPGCGINVARASVNVSWTDGKCTSGSYCHKSQIISCFSTVNPISAP